MARTSKKIRDRIKDSGGKFLCNDNIADFIKEGEMDELVEEVADRMQGLLDFAPFLALPATLRFRESLGESAIRERIAHLSRYVRERLKLRCLSPVPELNAGLIAFEPPPAWRENDPTERLYYDHKISVPFWFGGRSGFLMRVSPHIWNSEADVDQLAVALQRGVS